MKLSDLTILEEAIRFGQREINAINRDYANRVLVGVEYEIEFPDQEKLDAIRDKAFSTASLEQQLADFQSQLATASDETTTDTSAVEQDLPDELDAAIKHAVGLKVMRLPQTRKLAEVFTAPTQFRDFLRFVSLEFDDPTSHYLDTMIENLQSYTSLSFDSVDDLIVNNVPLPTEFNDLQKVIDFINLVNHLSSDDPTTELLQKVGSKREAENLINDFLALDLIDPYDVYEAYIRNADPSLIALSDDEYQTIEKTTRQELTIKHTKTDQQRIEEKIKAAEAALATAKNNRITDPVPLMKYYFIDTDEAMIDYGIPKEQINNVAWEPGLSNGAEVITKPLSLHDALDLMQKMFKFIDENGATSEKTGMHCNISIKGLEFDKNNFNAAKLLVLSDEKYITKYFPFREWVGSLYNPARLDTSEVATLVYDLLTNKTKQYDIINNFIISHIVRTGDKHQTINTIASGEVVEDIEERRVEFRFPGDKDYHKRYGEIQWFIYRSVQMLLAGFDPDYGRKEYMSAGLDAINKAIKLNGSFSNRSLGDLMKIADEHKDKIKSPSGAKQVLLVSADYRGIDPAGDKFNLYQSRKDPSLFVITTKGSPDLTWLSGEIDVYGIEDVSRLDITKYKAIGVFNDDTLARNKAAQMMGKTSLSLTSYHPIHFGIDL